MTRRNNWWILFATTSATSLVFLDNTILPVALPTIQRELGFGDVGIVWVVNAYIVTLAAFIGVFGRLYDIFGMRWAYLVGLLFFALGSFLGGIGLAQWMVIGGRVIQGIGGAFLVPTTGAVLIESFDREKRGQAMGLNSGISSLFLMLGPALGGIMTQFFDWRYVFWVNIPVCIMAIAMVVRLLPPRERRKEHFHYEGGLFFSLFVISLVMGLMQIKEPHAAFWVPLLCACALVFFALFVFFTRRTKHPVIDLSFFRFRLFRASVVSIFLVTVILSNTIFWAIYLQKALFYSPVESGLLIVAGTAPVLFCGPIGGFLADKKGARLPIVIGFSLLLVSSLWLFFLGVRPTPLELAPGLIAFGCGIALVFPPSFTTALSEVPNEKVGMASSLTATLRQLGNAVGVAVLTTVFYTLVETSPNGYVGAFRGISITAAVVAFFGLCYTALNLRVRRQDQI